MLAAFARPSQYEVNLNYAAEGVLACRLPVTRNPLGRVYISPGLERGQVVVGRIKRCAAIRHLWL